MKEPEVWPEKHRTPEQQEEAMLSRYRLVLLIQSVGVSIHGKWLSEVAIEAIEKLKAERRDWDDLTPD